MTLIENTAEGVLSAVNKARTLLISKLNAIGISTTTNQTMKQLVELIPSIGLNIRPLTDGIFEHNYAYLNNKKVFVNGGFTNANQSTLTGNSFIYNYSTGTSTTKGEITRAIGRAIRFDDNNVYIVGGQDRLNYNTNINIMFNLNTASVTNRSNAPINNCLFGCASNSSYFNMSGGNKRLDSSNYEAINKNYIYTFSTNSWTQKVNLPVSGENTSCFLSGDTFQIVLNNQRDDTSVVNYNSNTLTKKTFCPKYSGQGARLVSIGNNLSLISGGRAAENTATTKSNNYMYKYSLSSNSWETKTFFDSKYGVSGHGFIYFNNKAFIMYGLVKTNPNDSSNIWYRSKGQIIYDVNNDSYKYYYFDNV